MPTHGFSTKPLKVKLLAGEQNATENPVPWLCSLRVFSGSFHLTHCKLVTCSGGSDNVQHREVDGFGASSSNKKPFFQNLSASMVGKGPKIARERGCGKIWTIWKGLALGKETYHPSFVLFHRRVRRFM